MVRDSFRQPPIPDRAMLNSGEKPRYNTQTTFSAPPTKTHVFNATAATAVAARTSYCPLTDDLIADGWTIYDLPPACAALLNPYCWPDPNKPVLPSTRFPAICTPSAAPATSSAPPPTNAIPAPLEPSTVSSCKKFYKVLDGITVTVLRTISRSQRHRYGNPYLLPPLLWLLMTR